MSQPGISISGKTHNNHPQWHNQPLRLTKEQKQDPLPVLDDFFECYHLNDVRQILWNWLSEIILSQRSISVEPLDRNNHMYFYEKIEGVIEAVYVIKGKIHKHRCRAEKRRLKKSRKLKRNQPIGKLQHPKTDTVKPSLETVKKEDIFIKPKQLIEYVNENPNYVIGQVFKEESLTDLMDQLQDWLLVALSADCSIYEEGEQRGLLLSFQSQLLVLVEALFIINKQYNQNEEEKKTSQTDKTRLLTQEQVANPMLVITTFFEKFPIVYILRELEDWLEASICFSGIPPDGMHELQALWTFRNVLCLVKSANQLLNK